MFPPTHQQLVHPSRHNPSNTKQLKKHNPPISQFLFLMNKTGKNNAEGLIYAATLIWNSNCVNGHIF